MKATRSAFARKAFKDAIARVNIKMLEIMYKKGYGHRPAAKTEFSVWETEREWGDR